MSNHDSPEHIDPLDLNCDACGAEPHEPCRVGCIGYGAMLDLQQGSGLPEPGQSVLDDGVIYSDTRRFLCSAPHCAGATASATGRSLEGHPVTPITRADITWWNAQPDLGPLTCECRRLTAT